jgi:transposase-like protein
VDLGRGEERGVPSWLLKPGGREAVHGEVHKIANILDAVPSSLRPKVKSALHNIMNAENKEAADLALDRFHETYATKYPKAADKLLKDREVLLAHFDFPADHWIPAPGTRRA